MAKTLKLVSKRLRITKRKKVLFRLAQQGHAKAKEAGDTRRNKRQPHQSTAPFLKKVVKKYPMKT